jgi:hypothetical protein
VKRQLRLFPLLSLLAHTSLSFAQAPAWFRVLFGVTDSVSGRWDGTITAKQEGNFTTEGWRLEGVDNVDGKSISFSTDSARLLNTPAAGAFVANGFIVSADAVTESSEFLVTMAQGDFHFRASDVPYGAASTSWGDGFTWTGCLQCLFPAPQCQRSEVGGRWESRRTGIRQGRATRFVRTVMNQV